MAGLLLALAAASGPELSIEAHADLRWILRDGSLSEAWFLLDRAPTDADPPGQTEFLAARAGVRLRASWGKLDSAWALEHLPRRNGDWLRAGEDPGPWLREGWIEYRPLRLRIGAQPYTFQLRPPGIGEPMYLAPSESDSAWRPHIRAGNSDRSNGRRPAAHPDFLTPIGLRLRHDFHPFLMAEAFAFRLDREEYLGGVVANGAAGEQAAFFLMVTYGTGPWAGARLATFGAGADLYLDRARTTELFLETYHQIGTYTSRADRRIRKGGAWAVQTGARHNIGDFWIEAAHWIVTGDRSPNDRHDSAFQSYEAVNRFLIVEDATFGLGLENGYRAWKFAAGLGLAPSQAARTLRLDLGFFHLEHPLRDRDGTPLTSRRHLGIETDLSMRWRLTPHAALVARAAALWNSAALEDMSGQRHAAAFAIGVELAFPAP